MLRSLVFREERQFPEDACWAQGGLSKHFDPVTRMGEWRLTVRTEHYAFQTPQHEPVPLGTLIFRGSTQGRLTLALEL